jgi:hypothetical protein
MGPDQPHTTSPSCTVDVGFGTLVQFAKSMHGVVGVVAEIDDDRRPLARFHEVIGGCGPRRLGREKVLDCPRWCELLVVEIPDLHVNNEVGPRTHPAIARPGRR